MLSHHLKWRHLLLFICVLSGWFCHTTKELDRLDRLIYVWRFIVVVVRILYKHVYDQLLGLTFLFVTLLPLEEVSNYY